MHKKIHFKNWQSYLLGLPPLLLFITLHNVSETTFFLKRCGVVHCDNGKSLNKYNWQILHSTTVKNSWLNWQIHLLVYDTSSLFTDSNILQNSPTGQFHSNYHWYSPFLMWEVKIKRVTWIHAKPITAFVRKFIRQLTRYPIAGNKFLPSMTCPDKYFLSSSCSEITTDLSPDFDFPC
jgi:hypothetical protein